MKYTYLSLLLISFLLACSGTKKLNSIKPESNLVIDGKIWSALFQQRAAEYKALCLQAFSIARLRIDEPVGQNTTKRKAIISDIDETFLDNSPYAVHRALQSKDYDAASWAEWTAKGVADTLSGALAFFSYAASRDIEIFYITNRKESERQGTLQNLRRYGFPFADDRHLVMRKSESSKEARRRQVTGDYDIILLLGDNLSDFSDQFDGKTETERELNVQKVAGEFGKKFIVLPNANYGGWEEAVYNNSFNWTAAQKDSIIRSKVKGY